MDPVQKYWMFENWIADQKDISELAKNHAYLLASFYDPEAVRKALGEGIESSESTDEEFEDSIRIVKEARNKQVEEKSKRKRRIIK